MALISFASTIRASNIYLMLAGFIFGIYMPPWEANAASVNLQYRIQWGEINLGKVATRWHISEQGFSVAGTAATEDAAALIFEYTGLIASEGDKRDGLYQPSHLYTYGKSNGDERSAETFWTLGKSVPETLREPELNLEKVFPIVQEKLSNAVDPFSAVLNALALIGRTGQCSSRHEIYDGRRHSIITLHDLIFKTLKADRPWTYSGPAYVCGITGKPIGGHRRNSDWRAKEKKPGRIKIFIAEMKPGLLIPVRLKIENILGNVIARIFLPGSSSFKNTDQ